MKHPIFTETWGNCHIQGIAVDKKNGYIYYSFTTKLVKATLDGKIVGSVDGLVGHLGCIAFNEKDGCVYGSLEYKNDIIGMRKGRFCNEVLTMNADKYPGMVADAPTIEEIMVYYVKEQQS